jgi:DNA/RNA non-specific endonuclease
MSIDAPPPPPPPPPPRDQPVADQVDRPIVEAVTATQDTANPSDQASSADASAVPLSAGPETPPGQGADTADTHTPDASSPDTPVDDPVDRPIVEDGPAPTAPPETANPAEEPSNADESAAPLSAVPETLGKATLDAPDWETPTDLPPNATIDTGRYQFGTDDLGRVVQATGALELTAGARQRPDADRVREMIAADFRDQAGHLIAARFNGPGDHWNMVPQDQNLNVSEWKALENEWAKALNEGYSVHVDIALNYHEEDLRPWAFNVDYTATSPDGEVIITEQRTILNAPRAAHDEYHSR